MVITKINSKQKGFTLIELMIVISILLVLLGFMIPKFSAYQDKAKNINAINTAKQIQTAAMASYGDNGGKFIKDDVENTITTLTPLTSTDSVSASLQGTENQGIEITYNKDGKSYTVAIDASQNTYTLKQGKNQIYPKEQKKVNTLPQNNEQEKVH